MKKVGFVFLGVGCGILLYLLYSFFFTPKIILSPIEQPTVDTVVRQGVKN
jgi:hypothetical protein